MRFDADAVRAIVREHSSREAGVRQLARAIRKLVETLNVARRGGKDALQAVSVDGEEERVVSCRTVARLLDAPHARDGAPPSTMMYS